MAEYFPKVANNALDLKCAQKTGATVIVCTDKQFFSELDKQVSNANAARKVKSIGANGVVLGGLLTIFTGGLGLALLGLGALGTIAGVSLDKFKDYTPIMDYAEKRVIFLKANGNKAFDVNKDTVAGIDINKVIQQNTI